MLIPILIFASQLGFPAQVRLIIVILRVVKTRFKYTLLFPIRFVQDLDLIELLAPVIFEIPSSTSDQLDRQVLTMILS